MQHFDVAVAGGGPAGAATALALARAGRRVLLADAGPVGRWRIGEGLPPAAHSLLDELGVLGRLRAGPHRPSFGNVSAWGAGEPRTTDFICRPHGRGYQLDRPCFDAMLRAAAADAGATLREDARLVPAEPADDARGKAHVLRLVEGARSTAVSCRWLVGAGGRSAGMARRLGASRSRTDRLVAFFMPLRAAGDTDRDGRTLVEAAEQGWWYSALLPSGLRLVAYLSDPDLADRGRLLSTAGLWAQLGQTRLLSALCATHGHAPAGIPRACDASSGRLDRFAGERWLAAGDAALSFDPLSSQGISNALHTGLEGGRAIDAALDGDAGAGARYGAHLAAIHAAYLDHLQAFYGLEDRWPRALFWNRRRAPRAAGKDPWRDSCDPAHAPAW